MKKILTIIFLCLGLTAFAQSSSILVSKTPYQYEKEIRAAFREDRWQDGRTLLDEVDKAYGDESVFLELNGQYYYHFGDIDRARTFFLLALKDDASNTNSIRQLIRLERDCKNYSTAIDHINALLEFVPYDKGLWRQKIEMYRLMGNNREAEHLLERLRTIYPDDESLRGDSQDDLEVQYRNQKNSGDLAGQTAILEQLVALYPKNVKYHQALTNMYIRQGRTSDALATIRTAGEPSADPCRRKRHSHSTA